MKKSTVAALAETLMALAIGLWIGGMVALGAFTAATVFRDLPRETAAPTMATIFRSFDGVIVGCVIAVAIAAGVRLLAVGVHGRADRVALVASSALIVLGLLDVGYVHPGINRMFREGRTLEPAFHALHTLSSRSVNLEALCGLLVIGAQALARRRD
jgi:putative copper export protein